MPAGKPESLPGMQGPSSAAADYTIRMNYTTVPKTWRAVNKRVCCWAPSDYKFYYTSGFLSIQVCCSPQHYEMLLYLSTRVASF